MKKIVFYPILFAIDPILLILTGNLMVIPIKQLFPLIFIVPICVAGLFWIVNRWLGDMNRAGFVVFLTTFWFFHYGTFSQFFKFIKIDPNPFRSHWVLLTLWTLLPVLLSSKLIWRKITSPQTITLFLNIFCILITGYSMTRIIIDLVSQILFNPTITQDIQKSIDHS